MTDPKIDMVVLGSGCAGAAAACSAAELGARVLVIEKADAIGGPVKGANGPFAVESVMQRERQVPLTRARAFELLMEYTHWRVDARLVSEYINRSADTIDWLLEMGVKFSDLIAYYNGAEYTWHYKDPASPNITEAIWARAERLGAIARTGTSGVSILKDGDRVTGVVVRDRSGQQSEIDSASVVIATGGFGGNPEWIRKHTGFEFRKNLFSFAFPDCQGDGIRMAWEAGAGASPMIMQTYVSLPEPYWGPGGTPPDLGTFRQPGLMVNVQGERFMNEEVMRHPAHAANAVARQSEGWALMILDEATQRHYQSNDWDFLMSKLPIKRSGDLRARVDKARAEGFEHLFVAATVAELANETGVARSTLEQTIGEYNLACDSGRDAIFFKQARFLRPVRQGPFYAARFYLGGYGSLGGIRINHRTEVITSAGAPVPGLFAAGRDTNSIYGDTYMYAMSGNDSSYDFNTGRIAGEAAARYVRARRSRD